MIPAFIFTYPFMSFFIFTYPFMSFFSMFMVAQFRRETFELERKDVFLGFLWPFVIVGVCLYQVGKPFFKKNSQNEKPPPTPTIPVKEIPKNDNYEPLIYEPLIKEDD